MEQKVYITKEKVAVGNSRYEKGYVYAVPADVKEQLVAEGKAQLIDYPRLDAVELAIERAVNDFKAGKQRLEQAKQYNDAESLRQYEIEKLEAKLDADIAKLKADYLLEIDSLQKELSQKALQASYKLDASAVDFMNMAITQLSFFNGNDTNKVDTVIDRLHLLALKVNAMDDAQKLTVLSKFGELQQVVNQHANGSKEAERILEEIYGTVNGVSASATIDNQLRQLSAIKKHYAGSVDAPYRTYKIVKATVKDADL